MKTYISVPIATGQFLDLISFLQEEGSDRDPVDVVSTAIDYWMQNASWKKEELLPETFYSESHGYTWKYKDYSLFLPDGTEIRMPYKGSYHYAKVEGDDIKYNGRNMSPGTLANTITSSSRNAWRDLWIKRPGEKEWTLADEIRHAAQTSSASAIMAE